MDRDVDAAPADVRRKLTQCRADRELADLRTRWTFWSAAVGLVASALQGLSRRLLRSAAQATHSRARTMRRYQ